MKNNQKIKSIFTFKISNIKYIFNTKLLISEILKFYYFQTISE
jgi:hypothetical protein